MKASNSKKGCFFYGSRDTNRDTKYHFFFFDLPSIFALDFKPMGGVQAPEG